MKTSKFLENEAWELELKRRLPLLGHRNWVVVADSAYPALSNPGIEIITTGAEHAEVLRKTLHLIAECGHVRANVYLDLESKFVVEQDAPGVTGCHDEVNRILSGCTATELDHDKIISKLDENAKFFRVLILKSTLTIPYTSVFLELDCGYWTTDAERRLRSSIASTKASAAR